MQEKQTKLLGSEHLSRMKMIVKGVTSENKVGKYVRYRGTFLLLPTIER